jgi:hypothetical protein
MACWYSWAASLVIRFGSSAPARGRPGGGGTGPAGRTHSTGAGDGISGRLLGAWTGPSGRSLSTGAGGGSSGPSLTVNAWGRSGGVAGLSSVTGRVWSFAAGAPACCRAQSKPATVPTRIAPSQATQPLRSTRAPTFCSNPKEEGSGGSDFGFRIPDSGFRSGTSLLRACASSAGGKGSWPCFRASRHQGQTSRPRE